jgi:NADH:ubiquinone oxidoreductase subunit 4 (subunit M)
LIPWLINPGVSIAPNAYDLAEWASLHPASRFSTPPLFTSLLLRLPLVCLAFVLAFFDMRSTTRRWVAVICVFLITVALLPPLEFFTSARGDANYQQQIFLSIVTLIGGLVGVSGLVRTADGVLVIVFAFVGAATCIGGLTQSYNLMRQFDLSVQIGVGGLALTVIFLVTVLQGLQRFRSGIA